MRYTVRIEGKPEPVEVEADNSYHAAQIAVQLYDNELDGALSEEDGSLVNVTVSGDWSGDVTYPISCGTERFYRERRPLDPHLCAFVAEARKSQAARRIPPTVLSAARRVARRRAANVHEPFARALDGGEGNLS